MRECGMRDRRNGKIRREREEEELKKWDSKKIRGFTEERACFNSDLSLPQLLCRTCCPLALAFSSCFGRKKKKEGVCIRVVRV